jgi:hypothetical protein
MCRRFYIIFYSIINHETEEQTNDILVRFGFVIKTPPNKVFEGKCKEQYDKTIENLEFFCN